MIKPLYRSARFLGATAPAVLIAACAVPATEVAVPTMPMQTALQRARVEGGRQSSPVPSVPRLPAEDPPNGLAVPQLSTPEVRLAFLYEWVDTEGNKHFGEWVAIPIAGFAWIMSDGTRAPVESNLGERPRFPESP